MMRTMNGDDVPPSSATRPAFPPPDAAGWDQTICLALIDELRALREHLLTTEHAFSERLSAASPPYQASARNLTHYLALRQQDHRPLQEKLAGLGLSSLGHAESHVLANLDKVLGILHRLTGQAWSERSRDEPAGIRRGPPLLAQHTAALLGAPPPGREVRIMVTLPSEAAQDDGLVHQLVAAGMDIARIDCAHDDAAGWSSMAAHVRKAATALGRPVRILMELGGPKLRTGAIPPAATVLKLQPLRDSLGRVIRKAYLGLRPFGSTDPVAGASAHVAVSPTWLAKLEAGDKLDLVDARDAHRRLTVLKRDGAGVLCECRQTTYFVPKTRLERLRHRHGKRGSRLADLPSKPGSLLLRQGDLLRLTRATPAEPAPDTGAENDAMRAISCTLPDVFPQVCVGERIFFDAGRIGGVIREVGATALVIEIVQACRDGSRLAGDTGINLPDSQLDLPALTGKDIADLSTVTRHADLVGLSFVQRGRDIDALRSRLDALGAGEIGVILKIATRRAFERLPELLLSAMASRTAGVMIARGDLAVECGYERLAEVQEEILWAAEAAHMPVIRASQVLETLAQTGQPSRAEIADAVMDERAECVMLNKGPHILDALRALDDLLTRRQSHQATKRPLPRALAAWTSPPQSLP